MTGRPRALVTGASRRVGRAIALSLARAGLDLLLTFHRRPADAHETAEQARRLGARVHLEPLDLSDLPAVEQWGSDQARRLDRLDVLVHNASLYEPSPLASLTHDLALRLYAVNAAAPLLLSRFLAPLLSASPLPAAGAIVALADIHALGRPRRDYAAYSMSKAALAEMVRSLARDLAPRVRVNAVAPGVVAFPDTGPDADPEAQQRYLARVPLGRAGTPDEAAETVRWLALDASYVTGQIIALDGGRSLA